MPMDALLRTGSLPHGGEIGGRRLWVDEDEDRFSRWEKAHADWSKAILASEELFKAHVYENPEAGDLDFRQHRYQLYALLAFGESLAIDLAAFGGAELERRVPSIEMFDRKLDELRAVLHAWHGRIEDQKDLPDSFRQGLRDLEEGRVIDMETALHSPPPAASTAH